MRLAELAFEEPAMPHGLPSRQVEETETLPVEGRKRRSLQSRTMPPQPCRERLHACGMGKPLPIQRQQLSTGHGIRANCIFTFQRITRVSLGVLSPRGELLRTSQRRPYAASAEQCLTLLNFTALSEATITFIGFDLQSTVVNPDRVQGEVSYKVHQLTNQLADDPSTDGELVYIQNSARTASFEVIQVPERSATALTIIGLSCIGFWRRARSCGVSRPGAHRECSLGRSGMA